MTVTCRPFVATRPASAREVCGKRENRRARIKGLQCAETGEQSATGRMPPLASLGGRPRSASTDRCTESSRLAKHCHAGAMRAGRHAHHKLRPMRVTAVATTCRARASCLEDAGRLPDEIGRRAARGSRRHSPSRAPWPRLLAAAARRRHRLLRARERHRALKRAPRALSPPARFQGDDPFQEARRAGCVLHIPRAGPGAAQGQRGICAVDSGQRHAGVLAQRKVPLHQQRRRPRHAIHARPWAHNLAQDVAHDRANNGRR